MSLPQQKNPRSTPASEPPGRRTLLASTLGFLVAAGVASALIAGLSATGCQGDDVSDAPGEPSPGAVDPVPQGDAPDEPPAETGPVVEAPEPAPKEERVHLPDYDAPWDGAYAGVMAFQTPVYPEPRFTKRIGYVRHGGKVPAHEEIIKKDNCKAGWIKLVDGGFICGKYASLDASHPRVKLGIKAPDLEAIVPYQYAYNRAHGTPLYKTMPSREDMLRYEPYLEEAKKKREAEAKVAAESAAKEAAAQEGAAEQGAAELAAEEGTETEGGGSKTVVAEAEKSTEVVRKGAKKVVVESADEPSSDDVASEGATQKGAKHKQGATTEASTTDLPEESEEQETNWWESEKVEVSLSDLEKDSDDNLAKRMVKGFFVAVDKTFGWNDRLWYKTTSGLVAPTDRMYINKPPDSKGIHIPEGVTAVGFILSSKAVKVTLDADRKKATKGDKVARFIGVGLTGETATVDGTLYRETVEGWWMNDKQCTITEPGPRPEEVGEGEKWIDVNLERKTLVAFEGDRPVYAALVSPGKRSRIKKKDHRTPTGKWRIREKHIAVTMDGDGTAGDLPYSIEDVPYVAYYKGSYALHGAFWHNNFGYEMSHGCVNLSPLDAKEVFFWSEPKLPRGWHAVWATETNPGTLVVVHD